MNCKMFGLFLLSVTTFSFGNTCPQKNIAFNYPVLNAQAMEESAKPIRPGEPGKQPFWNTHSRQFIYAPAFNFNPVKGAARYRFAATSKTDNKDYVFVASEPWAALSPIWRELPVGPVVLTVEGLDNQDRKVDLFCQGRKFYRGAVFKGPYHKAVMDYRESAHQALEYLFKEKYIKRWAEDGQPDQSYGLYCYPSKVIGAVIRAMNMYSKLSPADAKKALLIAQRAAEYLISISEPAGAPLEYFTPTYSRKDYGYSPEWNQAAEKNKDKLMVAYAAEAATAFLDLYDTTKDDRFLSAAKRIADTYVKLQMPCGTWPAMVEVKTGTPTAKNLCMPTMWIIPFLERLAEQYGMDDYKAAKEKAFGWVMENPMKTFNWEGQFEDQFLSPDYENLTGIDACYHAVYLLKHKEDDPQYVKQAEELIRFAEDQFVVWESIMPAEYQSRKTLGYDNYLLPCALEQYYYMDAIGAVAAIIMKAYQKAYEVTGIELYLAKACELANSMTVAQERNGKFAPGRYPTIWRKEYTSKDFIWVNCLAMDAEAMISLAKVLEGRK